MFTMLHGYSSSSSSSSSLPMNLSSSSSSLPMNLSSSSSSLPMNLSSSFLRVNLSSSSLRVNLCSSPFLTSEHKVFHRQYCKYLSNEIHSEHYIDTSLPVNLKYYSFLSANLQFTIEITRVSFPNNILIHKQTYTHSRNITSS